MARHLDCWQCLRRGVPTLLSLLQRSHLIYLSMTNLVIEQLAVITISLLPTHWACFETFLFCPCNISSILSFSSSVIISKILFRPYLLQSSLSKTWFIWPFSYLLLPDWFTQPEPAPSGDIAIAPNGSTLTAECCFQMFIVIELVPHEPHREVLNWTLKNHHLQIHIHTKSQQNLPHHLPTKTTRLPPRHLVGTHNQNGDWPKKVFVFLYPPLLLNSSMTAEQICFPRWANYLVKAASSKHFQKNMQTHCRGASHKLSYLQ